MVKWAQVGMPDPGTLLMVNWTRLYDLTLLIGVLVMCFICVALWGVVSNGHSCRSIYAAHEVELLWTTLPAFILLGLAIPSLRLLYAMEAMSDPELSVKVVGHQWYWSYEMGDFGSFSFDSYMDTESGVRLLEVDKRLVLPVQTPIRLIITGADVIHSWAVPELGIKMDACPGRLNQVALEIARAGVFRGMCSELCGVNHAFMPIVVEGVPSGEFMGWAEGGERSV